MTSAEDIKKIIAEKSETVKAKEVKFYDIAFLNSLARASEKESCNCERCQKNMEELREMAETFPQLLENGYEGKKKLELGIDSVCEHLKKEHGYQRTGWNKPLYMLIGLAAGLALGFVAARYIVTDPLAKRATFWCISMGAIVAGNLIGRAKDSAIVKKGKNL